MLKEGHNCIGHGNTCTCKFVTQVYTLLVTFYIQCHVNVNNTCRFIFQFIRSSKHLIRTVETH